MNRKSEVQTIFSWIFMILIGTFFIYLSYKFILTYQENKDEEYFIKFKQNFRNVVLEVSQTTNLESIKSTNLQNLLKDKTIEIICYENSSLFKIGDKVEQNSRLFDNYAITTNKINQESEKDTYLFSVGFLAPFRVTNFLIMSSSTNYIIFDKSDEYVWELYNRTQKSSFRILENRELMNFSDSNFETDIEGMFDSKKITSITFITKEDLTNFQSIFDEYYVVNITENINKIIKINHTKYSENEILSKEFEFFDFSNKFEFLISAIYSSTDSFSCFHNKAFNIFEERLNFLIEKNDYLKSYAKNNNLCSSRRFNLDTDFQGDTFYYGRLGGILYHTNTSFQNRDFESLISNLSFLEDKHRDLIELNNCVTLY